MDPLTLARYSVFILSFTPVTFSHPTFYIVYPENLDDPPHRQFSPPRTFGPKSFRDDFSGPGFTGYRPMPHLLRKPYHPPHSCASAEESREEEEDGSIGLPMFPVTPLSDAKDREEDTTESSTLATSTELDVRVENGTMQTGESTFVTEDTGTPTTSNISISPTILNGGTEALDINDTTTLTSLIENNTIDREETDQLGIFSPVTEETLMVDYDFTEEEQTAPESSVDQNSSVTPFGSTSVINNSTSRVAEAHITPFNSTRNGSTDTSRNTIVPNRILEARGGRRGVSDPNLEQTNLVFPRASDIKTPNRAFNFPNKEISITSPFINIHLMSNSSREVTVSQDPIRRLVIFPHRVQQNASNENNYNCSNTFEDSENSSKTEILKHESDAKMNRGMNRIASKSYDKATAMIHFFLNRLRMTDSEGRENQTNNTTSGSTDINNSSQVSKFEEFVFPGNINKRDLSSGELKADNIQGETTFRNSL